MDVVRLDLQAKLKIVLTKAASLLPADVGQQLLALITPQALATMAGIVVLWAGAHFFGIGEIADVILLVVGWAAIGGVAVEAGKNSMTLPSKPITLRQDPIWIRQPAISPKQLR
ncbi:hypothetical protein [Kosakonia sp. LAM2021]|uniref:hypothetical protein n=1 Tax=Kosakonia sp. LAM2021 TaxID=2800475 RepID=UPI001F41180E|nr:hypothetical protein [Kosakonia sp. LAM2021]